MQPKRLKLELKLDEIQAEELNSATRNENCVKTDGQTSKEIEPPSSNSELQKEIDEMKKRLQRMKSTNNVRPNFKG